MFLRRGGMTAAGIVSGIAVLALSTAASADTVVRMGFSSVADFENDNGAAAWLLRQYVNENSDTLDFQVYGSSELGDDADIIQNLQLGSGAEMWVGGTALFNRHIDRVGVLDLPFLWEDYDHVGAALDGEVGQELEPLFEEVGFKVLGWGYSWGYRNVMTSGDPINDPEDLAGLRIRTIESPIYIAAIDAMGASATPMSFGEVYTALQTGVLDGFEHAASMAYSSNLYEVTDQVALTQHLLGPTVMVYSLQQWEQLTEDEQQVLQDGAEFALEITRALAPGREARALGQLEEVGMSIHEIDTSEFVEAATPLQDELAEGIGATDLLELIREAR